MNARVHKIMELDLDTQPNPRKVAETIKINFTLQQAMKAQKGRRGIALLFL
jgi:hypothetical protein